MLRFLLVFSVFISSFIFSQKRLKLIPYPQKVEFSEGEFIIPETLILDEYLPKEETEYFKKHIDKAFKFKYAKKKNEVHLVYSLYPPALSHLPKKDEEKKEKYTIYISPNRITINSYTKQGYFLALQTLIQLFEQYKDSGKIPAMKIEDEPKFAWRGMHLDVCRHFLTVEEVKQYIDYLAMYKLNTFHWHLTDDQGWRIEIKKYPKLTQIG